MFRNVCISIVSFVGCWSAADLPPVPEIGLHFAPPPDVLATSSPIELRFTSQLAPPVGRWPISVIRSDGRVAPCDPTLLDDATTVLLWPVPEWPSDERLEVYVAEGLRGARGEAVIVDSSRPVGTVETARKRGDATFALESPEPGRRAPLNLRHVVFTTGTDAQVERVSLSSDWHWVELSIVERDERGRVLAEVSSRLHPDTAYQVDVGPALESASALEALVVTSSVPDLRPPDVRLRDVDRGGGTVRLVLESDEPIRARGIARDDHGTTWELRGPLTPRARVELRATAPLPPQTELRLRVEAADEAGNGAEPLEIGVVTPSQVRVRISELVTTPLRDWGDAASGVPFDATPGHGPVTETDEWIELVNVSGAPVDLTQVAVGLRVLDSSPVEHDLRAAAQLFFGRGGDLAAWGAGEALVVRPRGSMAQRDLTVEVVWGEEVLDRLTVGRDPAADHVGGAPPDLEHESISRAGAVWRWCQPTPGDPQPGRCLR